MEVLLIVIFILLGIPLRVLLVEVLSGSLFFLAFWRFGLSAEFAITAFWCCVFLAIIFIDWEHRLILNKITYPAAVAALVILAVDFFGPGWGLLANLKLSWPETGILSVSILNGVIGGAIGFAFFFIVYFLVYLIRRGGFGEGDIKLAGLIGLVTGVPLMIVALFIGIFIGGIVGISLLLFRIKGRKDFIPYGTFLAIGPIIALLWGREILSWYLGFF
jgi:leader peptidase (prepilin peptidase)/N-methyltransferase